MVKQKRGGSKSSPSIPLQINLDDAARLVGGIVEKGFTDVSQSRPLGLHPPVPPRPNVLPFPVARHRSSGPHWPPNAIDDLDWDADEEEDSHGMELFASAAYPLNRKEKKGFDFNSWQKKGQSDDISILHWDQKERKGSGQEVSHKDSKLDTENSSSLKAELDDTNMARKPKVDQNVSSVIETASANEGVPLLHGGEETSLASGIDAENLDRLAKMSTVEIAAAQADIIKNLNPELINALRKRGQAKTNGQKTSSSGSAATQADSTQNERKTSADHADKLMKDKSYNISPETSPEIRSVWDSWSKRVENVRHMRFSLDGNIISRSEHGSDIENVTERDFIRTEGDPGASGYTFKEAVALTRSVVPGQRALALHLIAAILDQAIRNIWRNSVTSDFDVTDLEDSVDGEAIWAYCLGPEPELALSLRICLDDNHNSVVLACAKAIQHALSSDMNETIFDIFNRTSFAGSNNFTAPIFRTKPDLNLGFLRGGFWKYNTKPTNILPVEEEFRGGEPESQSERTIQDDIHVTVQDFAAGLVRMGILQRIEYLLENYPAAPLDECLISILIAIARHSPRCSTAVMGTGQLVQTVARRFASTEHIEINSCKIKSVVFIKVLAQVEKKNCLIFMKNGIFHQVTWQLYKYPFSLDQWIKSGAKACKLLSDLMVEQLRLWKVFVHYGFYISDFSDIFPSLCTWLAVPTIEKMIDTDVNAYYAVTREVYLLLNALACKLPNFYFDENERSHYDDINKKTWLWSQFGPIIDLALEWLNMKSIPDSSANSLIWVISSVLGMFSSILKALIGDDTAKFTKNRLPWLPEFVPKIGLAIAGNGVLSFSCGIDAIHSEQLSNTGTIFQYFYQSRFKERIELAISSTYCLQELIQVASSIDKIIQNANLKIHNEASIENESSIEDKILVSGIFKSFTNEVRCLVKSLMKLIDDDWSIMRNVEMFGRGGPSPGVGIGWGASGGGYWSLSTLLAQQDARLLCYLLEVSDIRVAENPLEAVEIDYTQQILCGALKSCLFLCPGNNSVVDKLFKFICQAPILRYLAFGIRQFLLDKRRDPFQWNYEEDEYHKMANVLTSHFSKRWLSVKNKRKNVDEKSVEKRSTSLQTIYENEDLPDDNRSSSLTVEWASSRLPLPTHWFLSAVTSLYSVRNVLHANKRYETYAPSDSLEVAKSGLFFLLGIEAMSEFVSPLKCVPVVWKLHALSVTLLSGMDILEDSKSRDLYATLQYVYAESVDELRSQKSNYNTTLLPFKSEIHENYPTFIETLIEQFAAESYGNILFGKQVALYLHGSIEPCVRLAAWNALSTSCVLELLPPLDNCIANADGYLKPVEDNENMLEAYVKSWVTGALNKASKRCSLGFMLPLHHLSSFIFGNVESKKLPLQKKLVKSLLRDCSRKPQHEEMVVKLICYRRSSLCVNEAKAKANRRIQQLKQICHEEMILIEKLERRVEFSSVIEGYEI